MKKYNINSYYSYNDYKKKKTRFKWIVIIFTIFILVSLAIIIKKQIELPKELRLVYNSLDGEVVKNPTPLYFQQENIMYELFQTPDKVKAVYLPAGYMSKLDNIIEVANTTEVNAVVIDIKDDNGYLTFSTDNEKLQNMQKKQPPIKDIQEVMNKLYENNIYPIARIVTFKDSVVDKMYPERMVKRKDGTVYSTSKGEKWLDPYDKNNWDYILDVCQEAINLGFKEIQFDYIRFHESMSLEICDFPEDKTKIEIITEFVDYVYDKLHAQGVVVSADVFGTIITSKVDAEIVGQDYKELLKRLDYICPMIYPSHYGPGSFGIEYPDLDPYSLILIAMQYSNNIMKEIPRAERRAQVRPWLQDFTASWVKPHQVYGDQQLREQINACYDALTDEWILWNAAAQYSVGGLEKE
ncbi:MAG: putative glycoside hydrolase [Cellulosilyticaceae bacterium]